MENKTYDIDTFEKLINVVNKENFDRFTIDFLQWLHYSVDILEAIREKYPEEVKGKTNWEIAKSSFTWIDDGKNDFKSVKVTNAQTGEVKVIKK
jgi:hypothetical protein